MASVALRKESVDRNVSNLNMLYSAEKVALRKESVDRNFLCCIINLKGGAVALRKESVDRNPAPKYRRIPPRRSLSARRAWIEMQCPD